MNTRTRIAVLAAGTVGLLGGGAAMAHHDAKAAYIGPTCHLNVPIEPAAKQTTTINTRPMETIKLPTVTVPTIEKPIECYY